MAYIETTYGRYGDKEKRSGTFVEVDAYRGRGRQPDARLLAVRAAQRTLNEDSTQITSVLEELTRATRVYRGITLPVERRSR